jgi:hypothetical protein
VKIRRKKCGGIKFRLGFIEVYQWRWPWPTGSAYPKFVPMVFSSTNLFVRPGDTDEGRGSQTSWQSLDHATADVNGRRCTEKYKKILVNGQPAGVDIEKTRRKKSCDINFPLEFIGVLPAAPASADASDHPTAHPETYRWNSIPPILLKVVGAGGFEPPASWTRTRRSTRLSHAPTRERSRP